MLSVADGLALGADLDRFPGRVLLGVVDYGEGHKATFNGWRRCSYYKEKILLVKEK
jgi:hypothetical protein